MLSKFGGNTSDALAAYNAGPARSRVRGRPALRRNPELRDEGARLRRSLPPGPTRDRPYRWSASHAPGRSPSRFATGRRPDGGARQGRHRAPARGTTRRTDHGARTSIAAGRSKRRRTAHCRRRRQPRPRGSRRRTESRTRAACSPDAGQAGPPSGRRAEAAQQGHSVGRDAPPTDAPASPSSRAARGRPLRRRAPDSSPGPNRPPQRRRPLRAARRRPPRTRPRSPQTRRPGAVCGRRAGRLPGRPVARRRGSLPGGVIEGAATGRPLRRPVDGESPAGTPTAGSTETAVQGAALSERNRGDGAADPRACGSVTAEHDDPTAGGRQTSAPAIAVAART